MASSVRSLMASFSALAEPAIADFSAFNLSFADGPPSVSIGPVVALGAAVSFPKFLRAVVAAPATPMALLNSPFISSPAATMAKPSCSESISSLLITGIMT